MVPNPSSQQPPPSSASGEPGGPALTTAQRAQLHRCYERAKQVLQQDKPDRDYAHTMFLECVQRDPGNLVYVEGLVQNLHQKYGHNGRGARFRWASRSPLKRALAEDDWEGVQQAGLELLKTNPWDTHALRALAQAAAARHHVEVELWYLKAALNAQPKDIEINRHCGRTLARLGQFDQAVACWRRVLDQHPGDEEALKMVSELTLAKTLGVPTSGHGSHRSAAGATLPAEAALRPRPAGDRPPGTVQVPRRPPATDAETTLDPTPVREPLTVAEQLQAEFEADPSAADAALRWAKLLGEEHRYHESESVLNRCLAAGGSQLPVVEALEETRLAAARGRLDVAQRRAASQRSPEAVELVADLTAEFNRLEIDLYYERCERYPTELKWQLRLGQALKRAGNFAQAIRCFRRAAEHSELAVEAELETGECWQYLKQFGPALESYQAAVNGVGQAASGSEPHKLALYRSAVLAEALGQHDLAGQSLARLLELDPHYRDAQSRYDRRRNA